MLKREINPVQFTPCEIGHAIGTSNDLDQRGVLVAWADSVQRMGMGNWSMQCRYIVDGASEHNAGLSPNDRRRISDMLRELTDHLDDPSTL